MTVDAALGVRSLDQPVTAQESFQQLIRDFVKPTLTRHGFRARGHTFYRFDNGNWGLVQLQKHGLSSAARLLFTINVSVASARLSPVPADRWRARPPIEPACDLRMRIGLLLPEHRDKWWTIEAGTDIPQLGQEVISALEQFGLPALERYMSDEALRDLWLAGGGGLTNLERARKLVAMLRAIGPADLVEHAEEQARSAAHPAPLRPDWIQDPA